ncbi:LysM peptidoglycan-binding domain-containing protein [Pigmentibacter sp. JX0631]|uniref:LysM peptidoglycan-binding domain-containing protein n=1 Tax=Pigmentibacter sp. JX0631 TaxID=2976982 RepID=UPI002468B5BC|nr:LysM peptidoglycan-binding domain-containing protein [Pigmentibacter sp. JX0631]WGL59912.1 LysM peptidoglycan-binding domain-containing protein [Pigmentibacter sp. JX0631]
MRIKILKENLIKKILMLFVILFCQMSENTFPRELKNIQYKVQKKDTLLGILKKYSLKPIYGKNGSLVEILKLNPHKINTKGNLIYPGEILTLPLKKEIENNSLNNNNNNSNSTINSEAKKIPEYYKYNGNLKNIEKLPSSHVYIIYKVRKNDMISVLLQKYKSFPIYGKKGTLSETLDLNPKKKPTKGDLIFPNELITLPISIEVLNQLSENEKKSLKVIYFNEKQKSHEEISYSEFLETKKVEIPPLPLPETLKEEKFISKKTLPTKIKLFIKTKDKKIFLNWIRKENVVLRYEIKKSINKDNDFITFENNFFGNKIIDYEVYLGKIYYYQVIGYDKHGKKYESNIEKIQLPPSYIKNITINIEDNSAVFTWDKSESQTELTYDIYRSNFEHKGYILLKNNLTIPNFSDKTIKPDSFYFYKIKAIDKEKNATESSPIKFYSFPEEVKLTTYLKKDYVYLEWNKNLRNNLSSYDLFRSKENENNYELIQANIKNYFTRDYSIQKNQTYYYKLIAKNPSSVKKESNKVEVKTSFDDLFLQITEQDKSIKIYWNKFHGLSNISYNILKKDNVNSEFKLVRENFRSNIFEDFNIEKGNEYFYKVTTIFNDDIIESNIVNIKLKPKTIENIKLSIVDKKSVKIEWENTKSNVFTKYNILKSYDLNKNFNLLKENVEGNFFLDTNIKEGNIIYYKITSENNSGSISESSIYKIIIPPPAPKWKKAQLQNKEIYLEWEQLDSKLPIIYEIYRSIGNTDNMSFFTEITNSENYIDSHISPDTDYFYTIKAKIEKLKSDFSDIVSVTSHLSKNIPSTIQFGIGVSYFKLQEYNKNSDSYAALNSAASTNQYVSLYQNWSEDFKSYFGLGLIYFDLLDSPVYTINQREAFLPYIQFGVSWKLYYSLLVEYKNIFQRDIYYQSQVNSVSKTMEDNYILVDNHYLNIGYDFLEKNNLHLYGKVGYIFSVPNFYNYSQFGNGYLAEIELQQQLKNYALGLKIFYSNKTTNTDNVVSTTTENGVLLNLTLDLGLL